MTACLFCATISHGNLLFGVAFFISSYAGKDENRHPTKRAFSLMVRIVVDHRQQRNVCDSVRGVIGIKLLLSIEFF